MLAFIIAVLTTSGAATPPPIIEPIAKNVFLDRRNGRLNHIKNDFVLISLNEKGTGRFYYVDSKEAGNTVIWSGIISAGAPNFRTPSGIFKIYHKKRKWMSTKYPDPSGVNNMDYSMFFSGGYALHKGCISYLSHGCIHIEEKYAKILFEHINKGATVIITRESYIPQLSKAEKKYIFNLD